MATALQVRMRYSPLAMSESGAPIYPSESKSVLRYSRKHKVGRLDEHLLAEAFSCGCGYFLITGTVTRVLGYLLLNNRNQFTGCGY
jgi:hypothetical protein